MKIAQRVVNEAVNLKYMRKITFELTFEQLLYAVFILLMAANLGIAFILPIENLRGHKGITVNIQQHICSEQKALEDLVWEKAKMPLKRLGRKGYSLGLKVPVVYLKGRENWFDRKLGRQTLYPKVGIDWFKNVNLGEHQWEVGLACVHKFQKPEIL